MSIFLNALMVPITQDVLIILKSEFMNMIVESVDREQMGEIT